MVVSLKTLVSWNSFGIRIRCKHPSTISAVSLTFWLLSQTGMWARGWVWEAIAVYDLWVILGWGLGAPWQGRVWEIHMVEPKLLLIACCPLQVVHQCPGSVAPQVDTVEHNGCRREHREEQTGQCSPLGQPGQEGAPEHPHVAHREVLANKQVHSVPRTGHCFSLLQKSKLLCKK